MDAGVHSDVVGEAGAASDAAAGSSTAVAPPGGAASDAAAGSSTAVAPSRGASTARSDPAARQAARARAVRAWMRYLAGLAVIVLALAIAVGWVWDHGEYRHAHDVPSTVKPTELPRAPLASAMSPAWHSSDRAVLGDAVTDDVVATYGGRTVTGRDVRTGAVRWSYTRTDRTLCSAVAQESVVMAVYAHDGICDEATGLDAATGKRAWTRTLFGDGADITLTGGQGYYLVVRPGSLNLIHGAQGLAGVDDWNDILPAGCTTLSAVLGNTGVLFDSACPDGDKLAFRSLTNGDKRAWTVSAAGRTPVSANDVPLVLTADGRFLEALSTNKGALTSRVRLAQPARPAPSPQSTEVADDGVQLVSVAGATVGLSSGSSPVLQWQRSTGFLNATTDNGVLVARAGAAFSVSTASGREQEVSRIPGLAPDARLWSLGGGLLAAAPNGVTAYRRA